MSASPAAVHELLKALVAFDTTSAKSNLKLIEYVRTLSREPRRYLDPDPLGGRSEGEPVRHHRTG